MPKTTRDRCITPSFSPSTRHRRKLMDGEVCDGSCEIFSCFFYVPNNTLPVKTEDAIMDPVEVTLRTFIPAQAIGVGGLYPTDFINNGNARYFSTAEDASVKTSQSALLSFGAGGEPVLDESTAEPSRTGETELFNKSDASLSAIQSGLIFWRYDLKPGAVPVETDQLNPTSVATPSISVDDHAFSVDFHLSATNPLPPPVHVASIGPYSWDIFPPQFHSNVGLAFALDNIRIAAPVAVPEASTLLLLTSALGLLFIRGRPLGLCRPA